MDEIARDGFDPWCAGGGAGTLFGKGVYFAENSSKADLYAGPKDLRFGRHSGPMSVILAVLYGGNMYEAKARGAWTKPPPPTDQQTRDTGITRF